MILFKAWIHGATTDSFKNFYLNIRRCLLHPAFTELMEDAILEDIDKYNEVPSCKLESLVEILNHHLALDDAPGVQPSRQMQPAVTSSQHVGENEPPPTSQVRPKGASSMPDKIVVYSFFTSSFTLIELVSCNQIWNEYHALISLSMLPAGLEALRH